MAKNFLQEIGKIQKRVKANNKRDMAKALFLVSGDSQRRAPLGPTGNLRANMFRSVYDQGSELVGEFIHLESYAEVQHDGLDFNHPLGGEAEFAKKAVEENKDKVMQILATGAFK